MTLAVAESAFMALVPGIMLIWTIAGLVVHVMLALAVWSSRPPRMVLVPTAIWGLATLFGGVTAAGFFWLLHYGMPTSGDVTGESPARG